MSDTPHRDHDLDVAELSPSTPSSNPRRRRALWGAVAALALAVGAVAVVADDDDRAPRLPLTLGAGAPDDEASGLGGTAADMSMLANVRYVAGEDLPPLGGAAPAFRLAGGPDEDDVRELVNALGLSGDPEREQGYWNLESGDAQLQVYDDGGGTWWYSAHTFQDGGTSSGGGSAASTGSAACAPDDAGCRKAADEAAAREQIPVTTTMTAPKDLPTEDEARDIALDLLAATGVAVESAEVRVDGPYDGWYVTVESVVEGQRAMGLSASVTVGPKGEVLNAGGTLAQPEALGEYPTIDTHAAIDRLNAGTAYGTGRGRGEALAVEDDVAVDAAEPAITTLPAPGMASDLPAQVDPDAPVSCEAADVPAGDDGAIGPATDPAVSTFPCGPGEPVEPQEVVLHDAERILVLIYANDDSGDAYLVPGYRMTGDDEWVVDVPSVDDESLLPAEPSPATGPAVDEPDPTEPGTEPGTEPAGGTTRCAQPEPGPDGAVPDICLDPNSVPPSDRADCDPGSPAGTTPDGETLCSYGVE